MRRSRQSAEAEVDAVFRSRRQLNAVADALMPEALHHAGPKARVRIAKQGRGLKLRFSAQDSSSLRAVMSSYLRMLKASVNVCGSVLELEVANSRRKETASKLVQAASGA